MNEDDAHQEPSAPRSTNAVADGRQSGAPLDRRRFLSGAGVVGIGALGSVDVDDDPVEPPSDDGDVDAPDGPDGSTDGPFAPARHDHSGAYGTSRNLGREAPVESITVEDLRTTSSPFVDVRAHGVVGDGETDDSAAFQAAVVEATPHGVLYVPYGLQVRLEEPVRIDLSGAGHNRFAFICHGAITPAPGIGDAITISDGVRPYVFVRVDGGGADPESDTAVAVVGGGAGYFEGQASGYDGTIYEFRRTGTYSVGFLRTTGCGQSIGVYDASPMGEIRDVFDVAPLRSPEFHGSSDICINQYENFVGDGCEQGLLFDDCLSIWADKVAIGGTAEVPIFEIRESRHAFFNALHLGGAPNVGGHIVDTEYSVFQIFSNINEVGVEYAGNGSIGNRIVMNGRGIGDTGLVITEDVDRGFHYVTGNIADNRGTGVEIRSTDAEIHLDHLNCVGNDLDLDLPTEDNEVHITDSRFHTVEGEPKTVNHVGSERSPADAPDSLRWDVGDVVNFTDTADGSGDGVYFRVAEDNWLRLAGDLVDAETAELLVAQPTWSAQPPGPLGPGETYGQTFTVDDDVDWIETRTANYTRDESAARMTLYEGTPDGDLEELASKRLDPWPDNEWVRWDFRSGTVGTFYLEMSDPEVTPTWWWQDDDAELEDVGGHAWLDRQPKEDANFTIKVFG
jgi:hypothetical protein